MVPSGAIPELENVRATPVLAIVVAGIVTVHQAETVGYGVAAIYKFQCRRGDQVHTHSASEEWIENNVSAF